VVYYELLKTKSKSFGNGRILYRERMAVVLKNAICYIVIVFSFAMQRDER